MAASSRSRTYSRLVPADTDTSSDVYVLDRAQPACDAGKRGYRRHTSATAAAPASAATGDTSSSNARNVVVLRDRSDGVTRIIGEGSQPFITEDGRIVLFTAGSVDSVTDIDVNGERNDIYSLDLRGGRRAASASN